MPRTKRTARMSAGGRQPRVAQAMGIPRLPTSRVPAQEVVAPKPSLPGTRKPIPSLEDTSPLEKFLVRLFYGHSTINEEEKEGGDESSFKPRFTTQTTEVKDDDENNNNNNSEDDVKAEAQEPPAAALASKEHVLSALNHTSLLQFLSPLDLLALWPCCKSTWENFSSLDKKEAMLLSAVFRYLRISEEMAQFVHENVEGSWKAHLPRMIKLCQDMANIYAPLEPDPAHRALYAEILTEQQTSSFDKYYDDDDDDDDDDETEKKKRLRLAFLETHIHSRLLKQESEQRGGCLPSPAGPDMPLQIGHPTRYHDKLDHEPDGPNYSEAVNQCIDWNREWMRKHASEMPNNNNDNNRYYRYRIQRGMYPLIVLGQMWDTEYGVDEWSVGVGPNREQILVRQFTNIDSRAFLTKQKESFYYCFGLPKEKKDDDGCSFVMKGGIMEYILSYPSAVNTYEDPYEHELAPRPGLGIVIWCMRHGLLSAPPPTTTPLASNTNNALSMSAWEDLIRRECHFRRDPVEQKRVGRVAYTQQDCEFLIEALKSPLYGPANVDRWVSALENSVKKQKLLL